MSRNVVSLPPVTVSRPFSSHTTWSRGSREGSAWPVPTTGRTPLKLATASLACNSSEGNHWLSADRM